jgi:hypothetical protein
MVPMTTPSPRARLLSAMVAVSYLLAGAVSGARAEEPPPSKALPEKGRTTRVFRLENAPASDVASAIETFLHSESQVRSEITPPMDTILVPDKTRNLVVVSCPAEVMETIDGLIAALDQRPPMVKMACKLMEIGRDGRKRVLSRPQVMTIDGQGAVISVGELVPVVEPELEASHVEAGYLINLKVHLSEDETARLEASINNQEVDKSGGGGVRLVKKSVQIIETIRLDRPVKLVIDKADDGSARSWMEVTVSEVQPEPPSHERGIFRVPPRDGRVRHPDAAPTTGLDGLPPPDSTDRATLQTTKGRHGQLDRSVRR